MTPFLFTFAIVFSLYVAGILYARKYRKAVTVAFDGAAVALLVFIPCCMGVKAIIDPFRFGIFEYPNYAAVTDYRVRTNLPDGATAITVDQRMQGLTAKFTIEQKPLDDWFDRQWKKDGGTSRTQRGPVETATESDLFHYNDELSELRWSIPPNAIVYRGPRQSNWRGFDVFWDATSKTAYEFMYYW